MKFSVATNFEADFIEKINKKEVNEIFGKLAVDFIGGGRSSYILPFVSKHRLEQHIQEAHNNNLEFNYLLNAACLGNREFTPYGQRKIRELLDWLEGIKVDSVTVTIPYLVKLIKKRYPRLKVYASLMAHISSLGTAKYWEDLGVELITLDSPIINRDFQALKKIRQHIKCKLQLTANNSCLCFCPFYVYHPLFNAHASQPSAFSGGFCIDWCILICKYIKLNDPVNFIRSDWIRPEDVHYYEDVGIDSLKIVERTRLTEPLALAVDAYTKRAYQGNLADLIPAYQENTFLRGKRKLFLALKSLLKPFSLNLSLLKKFSSIPPGLDVYIDNRALDNFLEFFVNGNCKQQGVCEECGYCGKIAARAVKIDQDYRKKMVEKYKAVFDILEN